MPSIANPVEVRGRIGQNGRVIKGENMTVTPIRPKTEPSEDQVVRERLATFDKDKKTAKSWSEVRKAILKTARPQ